VRLISTKNLGMVDHFYNPSYVGGINRRIIVQAGQSKNLKTLSEKQTKGKRLGAWLQL
jgi:hypothetical protein